MVDTFEKMDPINPTFDWRWWGARRKIRLMYFPTLTIYLGWGHLFNKRIPILTGSIFTVVQVVGECCWGDHLSNTPRY